MIAPMYYHCPTCDEPYEAEDDAVWCCTDRRQDFETRALVEAIIQAAKDAARKRPLRDFHGNTMEIPEDILCPKDETPDGCGRPGSH